MPRHHKRRRLLQQGRAGIPSADPAITREFQDPRFFPPWFRDLSLTVGPEDFAQAVLKAMDDFAGFDRDKHFATVKKLGTADQHCALDRAVKETRG